MKKMFTCSVGCRHAIEVERWEENGEWEDAVNGPIEINVWYEPEKESLKRRFVNAWRILRGKPVIAEGICLMRGEAQGMGRFLVAISSASAPRDINFHTNPATTTYTATSTFTPEPEKQQANRVGGEMEDILTEEESRGLTFVGTTISAQIRGPEMALYVFEDAPRSSENGRPVMVDARDTLKLCALLQEGEKWTKYS